ncbi:MULTISPECIES: SemiSWEET transporter [unclassified Agarivorans]|uniref:SemiSWEET transporter n=1 Tax=unclassified Agarivorans TaxID=2636026 RepID=UPI003D7D0A4F
MSIDSTILGYFAAFCTTCAFIPQVIHTWKTRDTSSISLGMYALFVLGVFLWLVYGILLEDLPIIIANIITFTLASAILLLKVKDSFGK